MERHIEKRDERSGNFQNGSCNGYKYKCPRLLDNRGRAKELVMSLDVYLEGASRKVPCMCPTCFNEHVDTQTEELFWANITNNLCKMAREAGIYKYLWQPSDVVEIKRAGDLVNPLETGLDILKSDPEKFKRFNPPNGWGDYDGLIRFVEKYLAACIKNPTASIRVSRR